MMTMMMTMTMIRSHDLDDVAPFVPRGTRMASHTHNRSLSTRAFCTFSLTQQRLVKSLAALFSLILRDLVIYLSITIYKQPAFSLCIRNGIFHNVQELTVDQSGDRDAKFYAFVCVWNCWGGSSGSFLIEKQLVTITGICLWFIVTVFLSIQIIIILGYP